MNKRKIVFFLILTQLACIIFSQNQVDEKIKIVYKGRKIEFQDSNTGEIKRIFDIEENNPFRNEPFQMNKNGQSYDMTGVTLADFLPNISQYDKNIIARLNRSINYASISGTPYRKANNYVSITYDFVVWNNNDSSVFTKSKIVILNNKGEIIHTIDPNYSVARQAITDDGKFLCVAYTNTDRALTEEKGFGVKIYSLINNTICCDKWIDRSIVSIFVKYDMCLIESDKSDKINGKSTNYLIFNSIDKLLYSKTFKWETRCKLREITSEGFVFNDRIEYFESDFNLEKLK